MWGIKVGSGAARMSGGDSIEVCRLPAAAILHLEYITTIHRPAIVRQVAGSGSV
jgi:hypothetical protein